MVESAGRRSPPKQQSSGNNAKGKDNLITTFLFNLWISPEFRFIQFVYKLTVWNILIVICETASKFREKDILKIGRRIVHV